MYLDVGTFVFNGDEQDPVSTPSPALAGIASYRVSLIAGSGSVTLSYGGTTLCDIYPGGPQTQIIHVTKEIIAQVWNGKNYITANQYDSTTACTIRIEVDTESIVYPPATPLSFTAEYRADWYCGVYTVQVADDTADGLRFYKEVDGSWEEWSAILLEHLGLVQGTTDTYEWTAGDESDLIARWKVTAYNASGESEALIREAGTSETPTNVFISGEATLALVAQAAMTLETVYLPLHSIATLTLQGYATLSKLKALQAKATLKLQAKQLATNAIPGPSGLNGKMLIITDPHHPDLILDQYLLLWFNAHPHQCHTSIQMDDEAELTPEWTWENPSHTQPAIIKIDSAEIPGDGLTHRLTIRVWYAISGHTSNATVYHLNAKTPTPQRLDPPEWCQATLIRQGSIDISDLTEVRWRHDGAVRIYAKYQALNATSTGWIEKEETVGYADYDDPYCIIENMGPKLFTGSYAQRDVTFGISAIQQNQFGPVQWASAPVSIQSRNPDEGGPTPPNPDVLTARHLNETTARSEILQAVTAALGPLPPTGNTILNTALDRCKLKIKDIIRQGGQVTLDHLGRFEARWNATHTTRSVHFIPSPGYKESTRRGVMLTDEEAHA